MHETTKVYYLPPVDVGCLQATEPMDEPLRDMLMTKRTNRLNRGYELPMLENLFQLFGHKNFLAQWLVTSVFI